MHVPIQLLWVLCILVIVGMVVRRWRKRHEAHFGKVTSLPGLLKHARLVYAEKKFVSTAFNGGWMISTRIDRGYRSSTEALVLVDLKFRKTDVVYQSDIIQLSAERFAIESGSSEDVSETAFVFLKGSAKAQGRFHAVKLMSHDSIKSLAERRIRLLAGTEQPASSGNRNTCRKCAFRRECPHLAPRSTGQ